MNELMRCRAMESLCRQRATFYPEESWKWLAEAEMWDHKAFECSNGLKKAKLRHRKVLLSETRVPPEDDCHGAEMCRKLSVAFYVSNCRREVLATPGIQARRASTIATYQRPLHVGSPCRVAVIVTSCGHKISREERCPPAETAHDSSNAEIQLSDYDVVRSLGLHAADMQ